MPSWWRRRWNLLHPFDDLVAGTAMTKDSSVSRSAMVDTEDGKELRRVDGHDKAVTPSR
jgi:hypothetical protein